jgi:ribosomal protein L11 methyltransferase
MHTYAACLPSGGSLYISGFYVEEDLNMLIEKCKQVDLNYMEHKSMDRWCAAKFKKSNL